MADITVPVYRLRNGKQMPRLRRLRWRRLMGERNGRPLVRGVAGTFGEGARACSRTVAEVKLVGVDDSRFSAIHTESNWRGAFEHTTVQAAIMAVLALVKRLTEHTRGSQESDQKIAAALDELVAAFKDRKPTRDGLDNAGIGSDPPKTNDKPN
jgi:hypothetical protein